MEKIYTPLATRPSMAFNSSVGSGVFVDVGSRVAISRVADGVREGDV
jgi:hypothetical protein